MDNEPRSLSAVSVTLNEEGTAVIVVLDSVLNSAQFNAATAAAKAMFGATTSVRRHGEKGTGILVTPSADVEVQTVLDWYTNHVAV